MGSVMGDRGKAAKIHPRAFIAWAVLVLVNLVLVFQLVRHGGTWLDARNWPHTEASLASVDVQRVVLERAGVPGSQSRYEARVTYRYRVDAFDYETQATIPVADRAAGEALMQGEPVSLIYNPRDPEQTLDAPPGPAAPLAILAGLVFFNGIGMGLLRTLSDFLAMGT